MNVTCPQCATVFRVDPAKVPERGVRARCSECGGLIAVRRPEPSTPAEPTPTPVVAPPVAPVTVAPATPSPAAPIVVPPPAPAAAARPPMASPPPPPPPAPVTPPAVTSPVVPLDALPTAEPPRPADPPPSPPAAPAPSSDAGATGRYSNPFLQQDPATRARRLARALVSDLVVYHPEKRQRGLVEGNLKDLFAEEIRKSWEEYTEQVGEEIATTTPYFTEALNEILAEGNAIFG